MYSWGGVKNFRMTKKISESFMAYEATKAGAYEPGPSSFQKTQKASALSPVAMCPLPS
jgi:hypothetical protein